MAISSLHSPRLSLRVLAIAVVLGILLPPLASLVRPLLFPSIFFLMLFSLMQIDLKSVSGAVIASPWRVMSIVTWQMLVLPLIVGLVHVFAPFSGAWSEIMFLTACAGTIFGAPAFAKLINLDAGLTLLGVIVSTLVMPLSLPLLALWILGSAGEFDLATYGLRLLIFVICPTLIAIVYHWFTKRNARPNNNNALQLGSVFFLGLFAVAVMDGVGERLITDTKPLLAMLTLAFGIHVVFFVSTALVFSYVNRRIAWTAGLLSGYRNLGLLLAVAGALLPSDFILFVALWQIPMYIMPILVYRWFRAPE